MVSTPLQSDYVINNELTVLATVWSACDADVNLRTHARMRVQTVANREATSSIGTQDVRAGITYRVFKTHGQGAAGKRLCVCRNHRCRANEMRRQRHHAASTGLWLQIAKRNAQDASVTYLEAVEIALCWGWIDGQKKALDAHYFLQRFTPRRARSVWSKINVEKVAIPIQQGRMQAPGLAQVEAAKADGRWARAYDGARTVIVPDDLLAALKATPTAQAFFAEISATNRCAILWRIQTAVKAETRARRIAQFVAMLARGETIHAAPPQPKRSL